MCEPTTIVMVGMAVASAAMQAKSQRESAKYNEEVAKNNAKINAIQAKEALDLGEDEAILVRQKALQAVGYQKAQMAANGGVVGVGSNQLIIDNTLSAANDDRRTIRNNARKQAFSYTVAGVNSIAQGKLDRYQGDTGAAASLMQGASSAYGAYNKYHSSGPSVSTSATT